MLSIADGHVGPIWFGAHCSLDAQRAAPCTAAGAREGIAVRQEPESGFAGPYNTWGFTFISISKPFCEVAMSMRTLPSSV